MCFVVSWLTALASTEAHVLKSEPWLLCGAFLRICTALARLPFLISKWASATVASVNSGPPT